MATLKIEWVEPASIPSNGYIVKYREVGDINYATVSPNPTSPTVSLAVPDLKDWEGYIKSDCGGSESIPLEFSLSKRIYIYNESLDISIVGVMTSLDNPVITNSFPLDQPDNTWLYATNSPATVTLNIEWTASVPGQHIEVLDANGTLIICQSTDINGSINVPNVVSNGSQSIIIAALDGICPS